MVKVSFNKDFEKKLKAFEQSYPMDLDRAVAKTAAWGHNRIVRDTPRVTGNARRSFEVKPAGNAAYVIKSTIPPGSNYTPFLEYGTGIHGPRGRRIFPKKAKRLVFPLMKGNTAFGWVSVASTQGMKPVGMISKNRAAIDEQLHKNIKATLEKRLFGR